MEKLISSEEKALELLNLLSKVGRLLIENGAEVYRIEDTIRRISTCWAGVDDIDVFAMPYSVFITVDYEGNPLTRIVRVINPVIRLNKIEMINQFSRNICSSDMSIEDADKVLDEIENFKPYSRLIRSVCAGFTSCFFSVLFGGDILDFIASFTIGTFVYGILNIKTRYFIPIFINDILSGFLSAGLSALFVFFGIGSNLDMVIIGTLMPYVPGVGITIAMRDILAGDYMSGMIMATKCIFTAIGIALGVGIVLSIYFGG